MGNIVQKDSVSKMKAKLKLYRKHNKLGGVARPRGYMSNHIPCYNLMHNSVDCLEAGLTPDKMCNNCLTRVQHEPCITHCPCYYTGGMPCCNCWHIKPKSQNSAPEALAKSLEMRNEK